MELLWKNYHLVLQLPFAFVWKFLSLSTNPFCAYPVTITYHEITSLLGILSNSRRAYFMLPHLLHACLSQLWHLEDLIKFPHSSWYGISHTLSRCHSGSGSEDAIQGHGFGIHLLMALVERFLSPLNKSISCLLCNYCISVRWHRLEAFWVTVHVHALCFQFLHIYLPAHLQLKQLAKKNSPLWYVLMDVHTLFPKPRLTWVRRMLLKGVEVGLTSTSYICLKLSKAAQQIHLVHILQSLHSMRWHRWRRSVK